MDAVERIKEKLDIIEVVSGYVELHKAGKQYKGKSPFTNEKTPSFFVSPDRGMYYCFSSQQGGDMFTFVEKMEGVDFKGALRILAERAGVALERQNPQQRDARDTSFAVLEAATEFFCNEGRAHQEAKAYITSRGVSEKTVQVWRIGYAPSGWRTLKEHLCGRGFSEAAIQRVGLIKTSDRGNASYDVFRDRIMFPIADASGRIVAFSGRALSSDAQVPKYVNSPETSLYKKSDILFGYDKARHGIRTLGFSLMVEGQFDVVLAHQAGYTNTVAVSGTALTAAHVRLLERLSSKVALALDADRAGIAAIERAAHLMLPRGMDVRVVALPSGSDPADCLLEDAGAFKKRVGEAAHVIEFLLAHLRAGARDERTAKLSVRQKLLPLVALIPDAIDREHFQGHIAASLGVRAEAVHLEVARILRQTPKEHASQNTSARTHHDKKEPTADKYARYFAALCAILQTEPPAATLYTRLTDELNTLCARYDAGRSACTLLGNPTVANHYIAALSQSMHTDYEQYVRDADLSALAHECAENLTTFRRALITEEIAALRRRLSAGEEKGEQTDKTVAHIALLHKEKEAPPVTGEALLEHV